MLYDTVGKPALSKLIYMLGSQSVAEEILQESFVKLWKKKLVFETLRSAYSWVYKTCTNSAIDYMRRQANHSVELVEEVHACKSYCTSEDNLLGRDMLNNFLSNFTDQEAAYLMYKYMEGLSQNEMSEVMKISRRSINRIQEKVATKINRLRKHDEAC